MKCPLFVLHILHEPGKVDLAKVYCLKGECAWWDAVNECCSLKTAVRSLRDISFSLKDIEHKLPSHERLV